MTVPEGSVAVTCGGRTHPGPVASERLPVASECIDAQSETTRGEEEVASARENAGARPDRGTLAPRDARTLASSSPGACPTNSAGRSAPKRRGAPSPAFSADVGAPPARALDANAATTSVVRTARVRPEHADAALRRRA